MKLENCLKGSCHTELTNEVTVCYVNHWDTSDMSRWRHQMETFSALLAICAEIHRSPVNSPHKGQWRGALMFSLISVWINVMLTHWCMDKVASVLTFGSMSRTNNISALVQAVVWCHQATSHYLSQCWAGSLHHTASLGLSQLTTKIRSWEIESCNHGRSWEIFDCVFLKRSINVWMKFGWIFFRECIFE